MKYLIWAFNHPPKKIVYEFCASWVIVQLFGYVVFAVCLVLLLVFVTGDHFMLMRYHKIDMELFQKRLDACQSQEELEAMTPNPAKYKHFVGSGWYKYIWIKLPPKWRW
jgi:hypothetical protein